MRTVWFCLFGVDSQSVHRLIEEQGAQWVEQTSRWNYPTGMKTVLYITIEACDEEWEQRFEIEASELMAVLGGRRPDVEVSVDVSGQVLGEAEVRWLADLLLSRYEGRAFDDHQSLEHAWTLEEIQSDQMVSDARFFLGPPRPTH